MILDAFPLAVGWALPTTVSSKAIHYSAPMDTLTMTDNEIFELGIKALVEKLGPDGAIRFLRQLEKREGDYSVDRDQWLSAPDVETLAKQIREARDNNRDGE